MKISAINSVQYFGSNSETKNKKSSILNKFQTEIKNSADMNDTLEVPRTIFKGYLAFTASTAMSAVAAFTKKLPKVSGFFSALSAMTALWGTYSFVRPYLFTNTDLGIKKSDK